MCNNEKNILLQMFCIKHLNFSLGLKKCGLSKSANHLVHMPNKLPKSQNHPVIRTFSLLPQYPLSLYTGHGLYWPNVSRH